MEGRIIMKKHTLEEVEILTFNRMSNWLEDKYREELALMDPDEIKKEFFLQGGEDGDIL